jgi:hypothetical protein
MPLLVAAAAGGGDAGRAERVMLGTCVMSSFVFGEEAEGEGQAVAS